VTPAPTWDHQRAVARLYELLTPYVRAHRIGDVLFAPADVLFSAARGVQPDLFVVPLLEEDRRPRSFVEVKRLLLAVEVLSPSTARWDRVTKRKLYRDEQVPEYWLVDSDARVIERSTPRSAGVEVASERLIWQPEGVNEPLAIEVAEYFRNVVDN